MLFVAAASWEEGAVNCRSDFFFFDFWASYTRLCAHFGGPHALPICCVPRSIWGRGKPSTGFKWWNFAVQTCCTCSGGPLQSLHSSVFLDFGFWARNTPSCGPLGYPMVSCVPGFNMYILKPGTQDLLGWPGSLLVTYPKTKIWKNWAGTVQRRVLSVCRKKMVPKSPINNAWNIHP